MATSAYYSWNDDGRPLTPAQPIRDIVDRMKAAYPLGDDADLFSWYADDDHYQADTPQDHTPYSYTPWPTTPNPYPYVFATDIMDRPDLGVACQPLFDYWIVEARAGRMPWLKYLIWEGTSYDVRSKWVAKPASGHYDHIHISTRTDHQHTSLGAWSLTPGGSTGGDDMAGLLVENKQNLGQYAILVGGVLYPHDVSHLPHGVGDTGWEAAGKGDLGALAGGQFDNAAITVAPHVTIPRIEFSRFPQAPQAAPVDASALAAALVADPAFAALLAQAAFEGAQRAEGE